MNKYFVSAISLDKQLGAMQFEATNDEDCKNIAEKLCPSRAIFKSYLITEFDDEIPVGKFVDAKSLKAMGY